MQQQTRLMMVCTANICRSPMAEGWAIAKAPTHHLQLAVRSGGTLGIIDRPPDPLSIRVMGERGIDISSYRSSGVNPEDVAWADHILVMEMRHRVQLSRAYPSATDKILLLGQFGGLHELPDPVGGWRWKFRRSRDSIERCVDGLLTMLAARSVSSP